jgi:hypothetical protein
MSVNAKLRPCPFCGSAPKEYPSATCGSEYACENQACILFTACVTAEEWNRRHEPQPDADGWYQHDGTRFPDCAPDAKVEVKFRDGLTAKGISGIYDWQHDGGRSDIIAWRKVK